MADFAAFEAFSLDELDFNALIRNQTEFTTFNDVFLEVNGFVFEDLLLIEHATDGPAVALFGGTGFTYDGTEITGGQVTVIGTGFTDGDDIDDSWEVTNVSVSAVDIYSAMLTLAVDDDIAVIQQAFSNDDMIEMSEFDDQISGFAGNDAIRGLDGEDTLSGGDGNDSIDAGDDDDTVSGEDGDDSLDGGAGGDFIEGGAGNDTIRGSSGDDELIGGAGSDVLYGDEFDIGSTYSVSAQVYRLYDALLNRTADYPGHAAWTQRIVEGVQSLEQVATGFVMSNEFQSTYGGVTNAQFVELLFQNVLGREPGPGAQGFVDALDNQTLTREDLALQFSGTQEFVNATAGEVRGFIEAGSVSVWVDDVYRLYQATLDRIPDFGGLIGWMDRLGDGRDFQSVVSGFVNSTEFQNLYGDTTATEFVTLLYNNVLERDPSSEEVQGWLDLIAGGRTREEVVTGFSQSPEFRNATDAAVTAYVRGLDEHDTLNGGTGTNILIGGALADEFVFEQVNGGSHTVVDLEAWDTLVFFGFGYASEQDAIDRFTQVDGDVVFEDQGVVVTIENTLIADISNEMIDI